MGYVRYNNLEGFQKIWQDANPWLAKRIFRDLKSYTGYADLDFEWPGLPESDTRPLKSGRACMRMTFFKSGCSSCYMRLIDADYFLFFQITEDVTRLEDGENGTASSFQFHIGPDMPKNRTSKLESCQAINVNG
ncbi:MAG: hypothetical protein K8S54_06945 [Spirochaetia bacterium]|nr:hypothetical protein [Spirochaetia bacterium]